MKKIIATVVAMLLVVMSFANVALADENPGNLGRSYTAEKATVTVDGEIDDIWAAVEWTKIDVPYDSAYPDSAFDYMGTDVQAKILYDDTYIYFLIVAVNADEFHEDVIEIYVEEGEKTEGAYSDYAYQMRLTYDKNYPDDGLTISPGTNTTEFTDDEIVAQKALSLSDDKKTATVEVAMKILSPDGHKEGDVLGVEFMYTDVGTLDGISMELENYRWNVLEVDENGDETGVTRPYLETLNFGDLVLGGTADLPVEEPTTDPGTEATPTAAPSGDAGEGDEEPNNTWIYIVVAAVVVVAVVVAVIVVSKKKK
ncbi:MAG: hypothetical protein IKC38_06620 [Clostridia bacterium]|nr:hypothetical protein [Clostridia bacterium]